MKVTALVSSDEWDETRRLDQATGRMVDTIDLGRIISMDLAIHGLQVVWSENPEERAASAGLKQLFEGDTTYGFEGRVRKLSYKGARALSHKRSTPDRASRPVDSVIVDCGIPLLVRNELMGFERMRIKAGSPLGGVGVLVGLVAAHTRTKAPLQAAVLGIAESKPIIGAAVPLVYRRMTVEII